MHDLAIIIVSTNEASWLSPCLRTLFERVGEGITVDVVVADNQSTDGTRELVERDFSPARVVTCENLGFSHANNAALKTCDARYVLFLNPDTETVEGTYADLVSTMDARPGLGLVGVPQIDGSGALTPTMRRFPSALRTLAETLGCERLPWPFAPLGERELRMHRYRREAVCDWTQGSFLFTRREAIAAAGFLDERFFVFSEETDLCHRIQSAGWEVRHLPIMTIIHHAGKAGINPKRHAQDVYGRLQYAQKHFSRSHRLAYRCVLALRQVTRYLYGDGEDVEARKAAALGGLRVLVGRGKSPYAETPPFAVEPGWPE